MSQARKGIGVTIEGNVNILPFTALNLIKSTWFQLTKLATPEHISD
jgi:hypothetical protein